MTNIYDLTQETTPLGTDILYILIDPTGTPEDRYITVADLLDSIQVATIIDVDDDEAFLVRKDGDGGDIFNVDTNNSEVDVGGALGVSGVTTLQGALIIDVDGTEVLLVRKNGDGGDLLIVDADNDEIEVIGELVLTGTLDVSADVEIAGDLVIEGEVGYDAVVDNGESGAAKTINWTNGNLQKVELTGDCTFTFTAPTRAGHLTLILEGDGTARSLTWPATVKWLEPGEPTWSSTDGDKNAVSFIWDGTDYIASGGAAN